jgi:hypothetical protein
LTNGSITDRVNLTAEIYIIIIYTYNVTFPLHKLGAAELASIVSCCPNIRAIPALHLQFGSHVSDLQQLSSLTSLQVFYGCNSGIDPEAVEQSVKGLAAVTQLRCLGLYLHGCDVGVAALLPLTCLSALTMLQLESRPANDDGSDSNENSEGSEGTDEGLAIVLQKVMT